ncbi:MAG TPA: MarR family transcriptional regulator [Pseudonocardiaceae bacterium]
MRQGLLTDPRITAMGLLTEACTGVQAKLTPLLARHGLSLVDFEVLLRLARSPGHRLRMSDLAAQTSLSTSGVTRVVDRLERGGMVRRQPCPEDRRAAYAVITAAGLERLDTLLPQHLADIEQWFTGLLDVEQLKALMTALRIVRNTVRPGAEAGARPTSS